MVIHHLWWSLWNLITNLMSLGIAVTLLAWTANKFTSLKRPTIKFSDASCKVAIAVDWNLTCIDGVPGLGGHISYSWDISHISF